MLDENRKEHKFHMMIGRKMRESLESLPGFSDDKDVPGLIGKILTFLKPLLEKEHQQCKQQYSRYRLVSPDRTEEREHMNLDLPEKVYRFLKIMHQDMNFYSIGQIIRKYLELFLKLVKLFGAKTLIVLNMIFNKWRKNDQKHGFTVREKLIQLRNMLHYIPGRNRLLTLYKRDYSPFRVFRL